jgi:hypothetical protein
MGEFRCAPEAAPRSSVLINRRHLAASSSFAKVTRVVVFRQIGSTRSYTVLVSIVCAALGCPSFRISIQSVELPICRSQVLFRMLPFQYALAWRSIPSWTIPIGQGPTMDQVPRGDIKIDQHKALIYFSSIFTCVRIQNWSQQAQH